MSFQPAATVRAKPSVQHRRLCTFVLAIVFVVGSFAGVGASHADDNYDVVEGDPEQRLTLAFPEPGRPGVVDIDNLWGDVTVEAADISVVEVRATRTIHAEDRSALATARDEVALDTTPAPLHNAVRVVVDGPFRCNRDRADDGDDDNRHPSWGVTRRYSRGRSSCSGRGRWFESNYEVHYDLHVRVPRTADVVASTVIDGEVVARQLGGRFEIRNVNGDVSALELTGGKGGGVHTVNGELIVSFRTNPTANCKFSNVNGDVDLSFADDLSAEVSFSTLNGEALSDFPYTALPTTAAVSRRDSGRFVYRSNQPSVRIGRGGPKFETETINGDILLRRHGS